MEFISRSTFFLLISIFATVYALSDVNQQCIAANTGSISKDFLLGTWFKVYQFKIFGPVPTCSCPNVTFYKPTQDELGEYREKYQKLELPNPIADDGIVAEEAHYKGLISGQGETKTYLLDPRSAMVLNSEGYEVNVYRRLSDKFIFYWPCAMRGHEKWLLTNDRNATEEEMQQIIKDRPEVFNMEIQRYCKDICY
uniref:Lipocalin/cytosolic fatty-acid binding domain-containing protein n=1 Tax=Heliothis virescens TaxID=7102 RepID=A0A2A4K0S6_HELVI